MGTAYNGTTSAAPCGQRNPPPDVSSSSAQLISDLECLINDRDTGDILFIIGNEAVHFYAHRPIVWARCHNFKKFRQQFWRSSPQTRSPLSFQYKHFDPDVFHQILEYIYAGQITLHDSSVFSVIIMATEFGLPELLTKAEEYILQRLDVNNACLFLGAAFHLENMKQDLSTHLYPRFTEICLRFIEHHAEKCIMTEAWLELPKLAIIRLVSSQQFSLEEDKVWQAVMRWAKYNTGIPVDKPPTLWSEKDRKLISQAVDGIIEHIKLLLIDSQIFAQEVEPTGLVPMETILERYRLAAVASPRVAPPLDNRLRPRIRQQLFMDTNILVSECHEYQTLLNQWCKLDKQQWRLLYRASRDGYTAEAFHSHCDKHAPTIVIVKGASGCVCGGYSDMPWTSKTPPRGRYMPSHRAFLFTLVNNQDVPPTKFDVSNSVLATLHHPHYGPMFGGGADLCIASNCHMTMESYSNFPHSYHGDRSMCSILMGDYSFIVTDYEVFSLADELL